MTGVRECSQQRGNLKDDGYKSWIRLISYRLDGQQYDKDYVSVRPY
ncbi:hypothetical protein GPY53_17060 [Photorhabdus laumondii subsp. laumondii]|nr:MULTISPECIES: hypothetical protein [Photorhabdus]MCC8385350.1 hypothetical protein [Photorhabdus laumondii]NDK96030.1 hypothetical protein [Photorhabdus laumondii subsp. laumondii]NDL18018.1 hypothetical protein [Photorhabdus laumondii subsp. laumondii]NDL31241.1 hypothetical protein [Photorhabdus laumondii subsp. laumondii]NDL35820.1 hypothetical protein [Photorhabdus laumondii subsp. laumondii]